VLLFSLFVCTVEQNKCRVYHSWVYSTAVTATSCCCLCFTRIRIHRCRQRRRRRQRQPGCGVVWCGEVGFCHTSSSALKNFTPLCKLFRRQCDKKLTSKFLRGRQCNRLLSVTQTRIATSTSTATLTSTSAAWQFLFKQLQQQRSLMKKLCMRVWAFVFYL